MFRINRFIPIQLFPGFKIYHVYFIILVRVVVQLLSHVQFFATPWLQKTCSTPGFPVLHYLLEFAQTHVIWVDDAIQPSHPLSPPSPPTFTLSQHQGLFQWVSSSRQVAKVLELQSFQWIFRVDFLWDWLLWSPSCPRDSQEASPAPQHQFFSAQPSLWSNSDICTWK